MRVQLERFRSRGESCRRVLARTEHAEQFVLEFATFGDCYDGDLTGVLRGRSAILSDGTLALEAGHFRQEPVRPNDLAETHKGIHESWRAGIRYKPQLSDSDGQVIRSGLRKPQIGALHAIASHWTLSDDPAVVVMPTGTGKTEVMIATAVDALSARLLVVVPTDALRQQTAGKFATYGILPQLGIIDELPYPIIGSLASKPQRSHFSQLLVCNVVISTMSSIGLADKEVQRDFAGQFTHVFFDEAHHIQAATWKQFQQHCSDARTLLLTATPFREDGKPVEGKIIYSFPLRAAQHEGYFKPIEFVDVFEPDARHADSRIAEAAVSRLRGDLALGYDHVLLARCETIQAARGLYESIYQPVYGDLNPVLIHSGTPGKRSVLESIKKRQHRIVVCVDMFGEGFDLPNLKIAALHSVHKSLGITLQFIGRFARNASNVGRATFVANTAEDGVAEALESLYREDADWNILLADLSYDAIDPQEKLSELVGNLRPLRSEDEEVKISALALRPKISAQVFRTSAFFPERFQEAFRPSQRIFQPQVSRRDNLLVLIVNQREGIDWTDSRDIAIDSWDLYVAYFDQNRNLLYIHSSRKGDSTAKLANCVSRAPVLIRDEETFKAFTGLRRLTLHSVGLTSRSRNVRYQMFAGLDVRSAIDPIQQQSKLKSNIVGIGYEDGERRSVGCSRKGKIWSMRSGSLADWRAWCDMIGAKLSQRDTHPNDFLKYTLIPTSVSSLPPAQAVMADWPDQLFETLNFRFEVIAPLRSYQFDDCQVDLVAWNITADSFQFRLRAGEDLEVVLSLRLESGPGGDESYIVERISGPQLEIDAAGQRCTVVDFFNQNPPLIRLEDGSQLAGNIFLKPQEELSDTYERGLIQSLDWAGVDIAKESRWKDGALRPDSIQQRFIEHLEDSLATFIIDDDDTGESADIVAIEETDETIIVFFWHCKYSSGDTPGASCRRPLCSVWSGTEVRQMDVESEDAC